MAEIQCPGSPGHACPSGVFAEGPSGDEGSDERLQPRSSRPMSLESGPQAQKLVIPSWYLDTAPHQCPWTSSVSVSQVVHFLCASLSMNKHASLFLFLITHTIMYVLVAAMFTQASICIPLQMCTRYVPRSVSALTRGVPLVLLGRELPTCRHPLSHLSSDLPSKPVFQLEGRGRPGDQKWTAIRYTALWPFGLECRARPGTAGADSGSSRKVTHDPLSLGPLAPNFPSGKVHKP